MSARSGSAYTGFVIAVDGPAGSGKSSTAREVARRLGFRHLDSGALYRTVALGLLRQGREALGREEPSAEALAGLGIAIEPGTGGFRVLLAGKDPGSDLRTEEVTRAAASVAKFPSVRRHLLAFQREAARFGDLVADGRDMGTVVFPDAPVKVFLTAALDERARRRLLQDGKPAGDGEVAVEAARIRERDRSDETRDAAPLREAPGALRLDTTALTFEEQVGRIVAAARRAGAPNRGLAGEGPGIVEDGEPGREERESDGDTG